MSRVIKNDHPFTDDEKDYLLSRGRKALVERNSEEFPAKKVEEPKAELSPEIVDHVKGLKLDELKEQLTSAGLDSDGSIRDLRFRLAQHLQAQ